MIACHFLMKKISKTILYRVFLRFLSVFHNVKKYLTLAGTPMGEFDLLIGCTAVVHKMVMK